METPTKIAATTATIAGIVIAGSLFLFGSEDCKIDLKDVSQHNIWNKLIEKVENTPVAEEEVTYGCELEEVKNLLGKKSYIYTDKNCQKLSKNDFEIYKESVIEKLRSSFINLSEKINARAGFADNWNYHLFKTCTAQ